MDRESQATSTVTGPSRESRLTILSFLAYFISTMDPYLPCRVRALSVFTLGTGNALLGSYFSLIV
jgi:hypothetical protein